VDGCTDVPTDIRPFPPIMLLGQLGGVNLMKNAFETEMETSQVNRRQLPIGWGYQSGQVDVT